MKKSLHTIIIYVLLSLTSVNVFASAAEKWEYDVVPDQNQKLQVTGHKVDQYGNAANDYQYKTKIDPKTAVNRTKMGTVGMNRLLKVTGWGILGNAALQALLEAVDWVIDPAAQSIWRYKKTGDPSLQCKNFGFKWKNPSSSVHMCPQDAATNQLAKLCVGLLTDCQITILSSTPNFQTPISTIASDSLISTIYVRYSAKFNNSPNPSFYSFELKKDEKLVTEQEKEQLKPEDLADYANHTHPDYSNPDLAPKLQPKYNPQIAPDLWKPANPWEYDNSPTVDEVKKELEQANPEPKDDKIKENEPDPETGAKSFSLPPFCSWATTVCEFIDSFKKEPELKDQQLEIEQHNPINFEQKNYVQFGKSCPFAPQQYALPLGIGSIEFEADATVICTYGAIANPYILALGHLGSLLYLLYALRSGSA